MYRHAHVPLLVLLFAGVALITTPLHAQMTWYVDDDAPNDPGPGDPTISDPEEDGSAEHPFDAIQEGIDAAADGDMVLVLEGIYTGAGNKELDFGGKEIVVRGARGPQHCIIDCEGDGRGFFLHSGETADSVIDGLTIRHGDAAWNNGGAVWCLNSSPTIANCVFTACGSINNGGALSCCSSNATIANCTIVRNFAGLGGAVHCEGGDVTIVNCVLWDNEAYYGSQIGLRSSATLTVSHCDVEGGEAAVSIEGGSTLNWGEGNLDADPLLTRDRMHLQADSVCVNAGDPNGDYTGQSDIDGEERVAGGRVDIGADEFIDTDGDELPDWWESLHFGSPTGGDPAADDDGDGAANLTEYAQSRDPYAPPTTYYVDVAGDDAWDGLAPAWDDEHGPKATIQAGIHVADRYEGDEVIVADGTYTGEGNKGLDFGGKVLTLRSAAGPDNCVIDCEGSGRGFRFHGAETGTSVIDGLTIRSGYLDGDFSPQVWGGGVLCRNASPTIRGCLIAENEAVSGGGVFCLYNNAIMRDCTIAYNTANGSGGGVYTACGRPAIIHCNVNGNTAETVGGGILCYSGRPTVSHCTIWGNVADISAGGGILCRDSDAVITNCLITGNSAGWYSGGGGGVYCTEDHHPPPVSLNNCTIVQNVSGTYGGGVRCSGAIVEISNCIVWANMPDQLYDVSGRYVSYSDIEGGWPGDGNIDADPLFLDPYQGNYRLLPGSPCIDAADNEAVPPDTLDLDEDGDCDEPIPFDLGGTARFVDDPDTNDTGNGTPPIVDMGAYEFQVCRADLDADGDTDHADLGILLSDWGCTGGDCPGDLDDDGDTDHADLGILLADWGCGLEP